MYSVVFLYFIIFATIKLGSKCQLPDKTVIKQKYYHKLATYAVAAAWIGCASYVLMNVCVSNMHMAAGAAYAVMTLMFTWAMARC